ncbi:facilitated trehalose transporter Tret1-like [Sitodiplosis mosellana]|uniref:facilitated trehalose transporter Tret1-like n=1 Tax=Sitodiplosis mosellana TaxID=263140 RepID=UPI002444D941|nr:facilitated trehalose transporter Tret1-like [Sitodiplosis mosellana]
MSDKDTPIEYQFTNTKHQYLAAVIGNLMFCAHGSMMGWPGPALPILLSENTPLKTGPLSNEQLSWIGSISALAAILGTFTFGFFTMFLGSKRTMLFLMLPTVIFWVLIYIGDSYYHVLIARFSTGWTGGGVQTTVILYISDIANDDIRGRLGSFSPLSRNTGVLIVYILGATIPYKIVPCIFVFIPIIFGILFFFLPNTPQYLLEKGQVLKAEKSLKFYKGYTGKSVDEVIAFSAEFERQKVIAKKLKVDERIMLKDIFNRHSMKGLLNGITLAGLVHLSASLVIVTYSVVIFQKVGVVHFDPYISSITIAVMQIMGTLCTTHLSDSMGRKILLIISLLGSACGLFAFSLYSYLKENGSDLSAFEWVPIASLSFVIFIASAGILPLFFVVTVENLPSKIRTVGLTICNIFLNLASFICLKLFPTLTVIIGLHGCMLIFGIACILGSLYILFVIKETKGISMDAVQSKNHSTNNSC